ncbi:hypothetical protein BH11BAC7_BH11BAC7_26560 [soil metagenome]
MLHLLWQCLLIINKELKQGSQTNKKSTNPNGIDIQVQIRQKEF